MIQLTLCKMLKNFTEHYNQSLNSFLCADVMLFSITYKRQKENYCVFSHRGKIVFIKYYMYMKEITFRTNGSPSG